VVALGDGAGTGGFGPFFLTSDGVYHKGNNTVASLALSSCPARARLVKKVAPPAVSGPPAARAN